MPVHFINGKILEDNELLLRHVFGYLRLLVFVENIFFFYECGSAYVINRRGYVF
jgi:hypothetical protein